MQRTFRPTPYKRISVRHKHFVDGRKVVLAVIGLIVMSLMIIIQLLALLPAAP